MTSLINEVFPPRGEQLIRRIISYQSKQTFRRSRCFEAPRRPAVAEIPEPSHHAEMIAPCKLHFSSILAFSHRVNEPLISVCLLHILWRSCNSLSGQLKVAPVCVQYNGEAEAVNVEKHSYDKSLHPPPLHSSAALSSLSLAIIQLNSSQASAALAVRGRFLDARREGELQRKLIERAMWVNIWQTVLCGQHVCWSLTNGFNKGWFY